MAGANGIAKFLKVNREDAIVLLKHLGPTYRTPWDMRLITGQMNPIDLLADIRLTNQTPNAITGPDPLLLYGFLNAFYINDVGTEWKIEIRNEDNVDKTINLGPDFTPTSLLVPANTTGFVTFRVASNNPPRYEIISIDTGSAFPSSLPPIPAPPGAILGDVLYFNGTSWVPYPGPNWLNLPWSATPTELNDPPVYWRGTSSTVINPAPTFQGLIQGNWVQTATNPGALNELTNILTELNTTIGPFGTPGSFTLTSDANFYWEISISYTFNPGQSSAISYVFRAEDANSGSVFANLIPASPLDIVGIGLNNIIQDFNLTFRLPVTSNVGPGTNTQVQLFFFAPTNQFPGLPPPPFSIPAFISPTTLTVEMIISKRRWIH